MNLTRKTHNYAWPVADVFLIILLGQKSISTRNRVDSCRTVAGFIADRSPERAKTFIPDNFGLPDNQDTGA